MAVNIPGVISMVFFYLVVLGTGIWASFKSRREQKRQGASEIEMTLLGNRKINLVVGVFTMTASWVGGGFIVGTAETVYRPSMGLTMALILLSAYSCSFLLSGVDAGATVSLVLDLPYGASIWISAAVAVTYTLMGGLYSVGYTDIIQLTLIVVSLWACVPFVLLSPFTVSIHETLLNNTLHSPWIGTPHVHRLWTMVDDFLLMALDGTEARGTYVTEMASFGGRRGIGLM
uniref:High-affinity choline transporter 1-like n=1 Tax=Knipowitschia caucasica TaxID=637954 RepID=A0AAV2JHT8_KNICA